MVLSNTGQKAASAIRNTLGPEPMPKVRMITGMKATIGVARTKSRNGWAATRRVVLSPTTTPTVTPTTMAMASPVRTLRMLNRTSCTSVPCSSASLSATRTSDSGGK